MQAISCMRRDHPKVMALQITEAFYPSDSSTGSNSFFSMPPPTLKISTACKSLYQYEFVHLRQNPTSQGQLSDIDIYKTLANPNSKPDPKPKPSLFKSLKTCLPCNNPPEILPNEYFQITEPVEHPVPSGEQEKFITLKIPNQSRNCFSYDYVHVGAIRLFLTFHNIRGLPIGTRIALLDSRYKNYHHACMGMVETTVNSGTLVLTMFPNCTISREDRNRSTVFLVQIQIVGATMDPGLVQATLYSQMACRYQHHAFGLGVDSSGDFPLIQIKSGNEPTTIHIPTRITRPELVAILPEPWVSSYEKRHMEEQEVEQSRRNPFIRNADGTVTFRLIGRKP